MQTIEKHSVTFDHFMWYFNVNMQMFKSVQNILKFIGLCSVPNKYLHFGQQIICLIVLILLVFMSSASAYYIYGHTQVDDLENSLYAFFQLAAAICDIGSILSISYHKDKVKIIIDELQDIYDQCECVFHLPSLHDSAFAVQY